MYLQHMLLKIFRGNYLEIYTCQVSCPLCPPCKNMGGGLCPPIQKSKQCFQRKTMSPNRNLGRQACLLPLLCHNDPSIISRENMHNHNYGQTLKLKSVVVTVNIRSRSLKTN